jgi:hypothetical protein
LMYSLRLYNRKISFRRRPQGGDTDLTRDSHH